MTVVLEDQVANIVKDLSKGYGRFGGGDTRDIFADGVSIEQVVRDVIARYDISTIAQYKLAEGG